MNSRILLFLMLHLSRIADLGTGRRPAVPFMPSTEEKRRKSRRGVEKRS